MKNKKKNRMWYQKIWNTKWMRNASIGTGVVLITVLGYIGQQYGGWLGASIVSVPKCVQDSGRILTFPVPGIVNSISQQEVLKAIEDRKISSLNGMPYSYKPSQLKQKFSTLLTATSLSDLTNLETENYSQSGHVGIDLPIWWAKDDNGNQLDVPIVAPFNQAQVYKVWDVNNGSATWGNAITLCFSNNLGTYFAHFAHMKDLPSVKEGQMVKQGDRLGLVGNTGDSYGAHLHFQINKFARYNPYYTSNKDELVSTFIDPLMHALKPNITMSNVLVAGDVPTDVNNNGTSGTGGNLLEASIFNIKISPEKNEAKVGEFIPVNVEAYDKNGVPVSGTLLYTTSNETAVPVAVNIDNKGKGTLKISSPYAEQVVVTVTTEDKTVSQKVALRFTGETETATIETAIETPSDMNVVFTDVTPTSVTSAEYEAIKYLKEKGITTGNPDGSFGATQELNRAAAATFLIRALYPEIDLSKVTIGAMPFGDVPLDAWFASAIYIANQSTYNGKKMPVFIKGSNGKANPSQPVKLEEFAAMVLRVLQVEAMETEIWYDGYLTKMSQLGLTSQNENINLLGKSLNRKTVARILHQAMLWYEKNPNGLKLTDAEKSTVSNAAISTTEQPIIPPAIDAPQNLEVRINDNGKVVLQWLPSATPNIGYIIYRSTQAEEFQELMSNLTSPTYMDSYARAGDTYNYKVVAKNLNTGETSEFTNIASITL